MMVAKEDRESYRSALMKGLGRALQAARTTGKLIDEDAVLDACLHNRCFDPQLEGSRAPWLIEILSAAEAIDRFQGPILQALSTSSYTWDIDQLCGFAEFYASRGVQGARENLYRILDQRPAPSAPWLAEGQIVRLDGIDGFLRIAAQRGAAIRRGEDIRDLAVLAEDVERTFGTDVIATSLTNAAASSQDARAYHDRLRDERLRASARPRMKRPDRLRAITLDQILAAINMGDHSVRTADLAGWGRYASAESLRQVVSRMFEERDPVKIAKYLRVFYRAPLLEFDDRLIDLLDHADSEVRRRAMSALAENKAPAVRALALRRLTAGYADEKTIALLKHNYDAGDHRLLESILVPSDDPGAMHDLCWGLEEVFHENRTPDCAVSMLFAYEHTPCSQCRERFVARLVEFDKTPAEVIEECRFDANPEIRELVGAT